MYTLLRAFLFALDPEKAHHWTLTVAAWILKLPGMPALWAAVWPRQEDRWQGMGLVWPNRVGLAAGFDKDAKYLHVWKAMGFGFVEVGTLTPRPQSGNPRPRLFRLVRDRALINRMGFNNEGMEAAFERLQYRPEGLVVGANVGKNKDTPNSEAVADYVQAVQRLHPRVDFFTINLSSPNTPGLRDLQDALFLENLLQHINELPCQRQSPKPLWVKLAPDLEEAELLSLWPVLVRYGVAAVVLTNTTVGREGLVLDSEKVQALGQGGLSGAPLAAKSLKALKTLVPLKAQGKEEAPLEEEAPFLVSVGGIMSGAEAVLRIKAGASLVQVYTGLVYSGPSLVGDCASGIRDALGTTHCSKA